ncbi:MAG TPA: transcriptional regulator, partial [Lachnospiraceae bacterium]|nr:transcriptional regulator [Lachnospiraceae bacterium]
MKIELGIGQRTQAVEIADENIIDVLTPNPVKYDLMGEDEVKRALAAPIASPRLKDIVKPGEKIVM